MDTDWDTRTVRFYSFQLLNRFITTAALHTAATTAEDVVTRQTVVVECGSMIQLWNDTVANKPTRRLRQQEARVLERSRAAFHDKFTTYKIDLKHVRIVRIYR